MKTRRQFQFTLISLLLLMPPLAVLFTWIRPFFVELPLWMPYSKRALDQKLKAGRLVLVYFDATWDITSITNRKNELQTHRVEFALRRSLIVSMIADSTNGFDEAEVRRVSGSTMLPLLVIYSPNSSVPPKWISGHVTENSVIQLIKQMVAVS